MERRQLGERIRRTVKRIVGSGGKPTVGTLVVAGAAVVGLVIAAAVSGRGKRQAPPEPPPKIELVAEVSPEEAATPAPAATPVVTGDEAPTEVSAGEAPVPLAAAEPEAEPFPEVPAAPPPEPVFDVAYQAHIDVFETTFDPIPGARVTGPDGVEIKFRPASFRTPAGEPVVGPVKARWTLIDSPKKLDAVPGELATHIDGEQVPLQSFGMIELELTHADGPVELSDPGEASFPLREGHGLEEGQRVGIYYLDATRGTWVHEGNGTVKEGRFTGVPITRAGWWNCDEPLRNRGCVRGRIAHEGWELPSDTRARLVGVEYMTRTSTSPDDAGEFCVDGMPGVEAKIEAYQTGAQCFVLESRMVAASEAGTSCFVDRTACTEVVVHPQPVSCELADAAFKDFGGDQRAPRDEKWDREWEESLSFVYAPLDVILPTDVTGATLKCGRMVVRDLELTADGRIQGEQAPAAPGCRLVLRSKDKLWNLVGVRGGRQYVCEHSKRKKEIVCEESTASVDEVGAPSD